MKVKNRWKRLTSLLLAMVLTASLVACGSKSNEDGNTSDGDTLTVAYRAEATNLDPHNSQSLTAFSIEMLIFDRLVEKDADGNIIPSLATKWEEIDDTTMRFYLRDDVTFHNGEKLTAEDVKYTIERAEVMPGSTSLMSKFDGEGTTVVDDYTIDIKFHEPFGPVLNYLSSARGNIVCKSAVEEAGSDAYGRSPVGSGPMKFEKWVSGDSITLTKNENYWGDKPVYNTFVARFITEDGSRAIELETGGVDIAMNVADSDMRRLLDNKDVTIYNQPSLATLFMTINQDGEGHELFRDLRVRQAMYEALDIDTIIANVYSDTAVVADSIFSSQVSFYTPVGKPDYDPEHAKQLLAEAGWDSGKTFELLTGNANQKHASLAEIICNMWAQVGINVKVSSVDTVTYLDRTANSAYDIQLSEMSASTGDPDHALWEWKDPGYGMEATDEIKELINRGRMTYDEETRAEIYAEMQKLCWDYHAAIPMAFTNVIYGTRANIQNMDANPGNVPNFAHVTFSN